ncbi:MAG: cupredoxin domain-containing protein [Thermoproteota archaeon]
MSKQKKQSRKWNGKAILAIIGFVLIGSTVGYSAYNSMIPANGKFPVFGVPQNIYLISKYHPQLGSIFATKSTTSGKKSLGATHTTPEIHVRKDQLASIHYINEDADSKHNLNIDEFNVHTKDLGYFETQTITFIADKSGTFRYYCSIHPQMSGNLIVD